MNKANFHHIHLNVTDIEATIAYYQKYFGAKKISYRDKSEALFTEKSFFLLDQVENQPETHLGSSLWHIGWSGVDGQSEFDWRVKEGIEVHTGINPLGDDHWMYFYGPNKEVVEVFTGNKNHSFEHIHLLAENVDETMDWFKTHLGLPPVNELALTWGTGLFQWNVLNVGNINIMVNGRPVEERTWFPKNFKPTDGTVLDHIGFSYQELEPVYERIKSHGVQIVQEIAVDPVHGLKSFFLRGPNQLLIEIVEEKPIPEGIWI
ncbi:VOC family protein [Flagellimonas nanhaiensis]|uniref:VOC family protein n=1 Tax=Flagellimonas nanhaiensis TaxID=2292706 RepID=A0A371JKX6_9FLAO|nr:VOC family protein [Allomuricauda nanhaiensis]RDY57588.1 VOC family protein [Allomuricauda nanhaiensis]